MVVQEDFGGSQIFGRKRTIVRYYLDNVYLLATLHELLPSSDEEPVVTAIDPLVKVSVYGLWTDETSSRFCSMNPVHSAMSPHQDMRVVKASAN